MKKTVRIGLEKRVNLHRWCRLCSHLHSISTQYRGFHVHRRAVFFAFFGGGLNTGSHLVFDTDLTGGYDVNPLGGYD